MANIEEKVETLVTPIINNLGYIVYDVIYAKEGKDHYLRIFIDKDSGISLDDCEKVNNEITDILDKENIINEQYYLEVSSSGIERTIRKDKQLEGNIGNKIKISLYKNQEDSKELIGILNSYDDKCIIIKNINEQDKIIEIDKKNISNIKTVYDW